MDTKNILLVDDDNIFNLLNRRMVEKTGLAGEIHTALNGQQALDLINEYYSGSSTFPDVILLDLNMPIMDGFTFLEAFRRINLPGKDQVKIIIVTSSEDPKDRAKASTMGITQYLAKPITEDTLRAALLG
jgi:CheY-like chemotaxis protein